MSRLSELSRLIETSRRAGTDVRPTLLKILVDLFVESPVRSTTESERFCELALRLLEVSDLATRQAVATRLAPCPYVPKPILVRLALDDFSVAGPLIAASPRMDKDLLATLDVVAGPKHRLAIAARRATDDLDKPQRPPATVGATVSPASEAAPTRFAAAGEDVLFEIRAAAPKGDAPTSDTPTSDAPRSASESSVPLASPAALPLPELRLPPMPVFMAPPDVVAPPVPAPMVEPVDTAAPEPAAIVHPAPVETAPVAVPERVPAPIDPRPLAQLLDDPAASMASIAAAFLRADEKTRLDALASLTLSGRPAALLPTKVAGIDIGRALESAALHRRTAQFANLVGEALTLSPDVAARLVEDSGGEAIVAALRALDIDSELVLRIMLFLNPQIGVSVTRVFALSSLYDQLDRHVALQLVAGWQDLDPVDVATRPPRHVAATAVDGALRARSDTTAARLPDRAATRETGTHGR